VIHISSGWPSRGTPRVILCNMGGSVRGDPGGVVRSPVRARQCRSSLPRRRGGAGGAVGRPDHSTRTATMRERRCAEQTRAVRHSTHWVPAHGCCACQRNCQAGYPETPAEAVSRASPAHIADEPPAPPNAQHSVHYIGITRLPGAQGRCLTSRRRPVPSCDVRSHRQPAPFRSDTGHARSGCTSRRA
jgi:hypothetical protein